MVGPIGECPSCGAWADPFHSVWAGVEDLLPDDCAGLLGVVQDSKKSWPARLRASVQLGRLGEAAKGGIPLLTACLAGEDAKPRALAAIALGHMGAEAKDAVPALMHALESHDDSARGAVASALAHIDPDARVPASTLTRALNDAADYHADARMRATFESSPIGLALIDDEGGVIRANRALRDLTAQFDAVGRGLFDNPFDVEGLGVPPAHLRELFADARPWIIQRTRLRRDGDGDRHFWIEVSVYPVRDEDGQVLCATFILENITDEVHAAEGVRRREQTNRTLLRAIPDHIFHLSADGTFLDYAHGANVDALVQPREIVGLKIEQVVPDGQAREAMDCLRRALASGNVEVRRYDQWFDTTQRFFEARYAAIEDNAVLAIVRDVTDQKWRQIGRDTLHALSDLFLRSEDVESVYREAPTILASGFGFPISSIELYDAPSESMLIVGSAGIAGKDSGVVRVPCDRTISGTVARTVEPFASPDVSEHPDHTAPSLRRTNARALLCVPMRGEEAAVGTVCLADTRVRDIPPVLSEALVSVANYLGESISRRRARADLRSVVSAARCLLWEADVSLHRTSDDPHGQMHWDARPIDEGSGRRFLRLDVHPPETYHDAWFRTRMLGDDAASHVTADTAIRAGRPGYDQEFRCIDRDGAVRWIQEDVFIEPRGEDRWHCVGVCTDVTERKRIERMKDEFMSSVSHELRTPLTSIMASLQLVMDGAAGDLTEQTRGLLGIARANSDRLARLVNDILDIGRLESDSGAFDIEPIELAPAIADAVQANRPFADELDVELAFQNPTPGVFVEADAGRLSQLMTNLLANAAKFSPAHDRVTITMEARDGWARVSVADNGPGIPEAARSSLFDRFTQVDGSNTRRHGGTGLGLAIAKAIVDRMGGRIGLESKVGVGTTFFFELRTLPPTTTVAS